MFHVEHRFHFDAVALLPWEAARITGVTSRPLACLTDHRREPPFAVLEQGCSRCATTIDIATVNQQVRV
jgi:hypothetical protein